MTSTGNSPSAWENMDPKAEATSDFTFTGQAGELWPIALKNLLFNILTLSLYRFWGRTNVRRYLWANIRFRGDPLEYTGTGGELFKGFVVVFFTIFLPVIGLVTWAQMLIAEGKPVGSMIFFAVYMVMLWLLPLALYRAQKYRLSRTRWRGIRGALEQNGTGYAWRFLGYGFLTWITLGLALPVMENRLWTYETNNRRFGTGKFSYNASSGALYGAFIMSILIMIVGGAITVTLMGGIMASVFAPFLESSVGDEGTITQITYVMIFQVLLIYLVFGIFVALAFSVYEVRKIEHFWNNSHFEGARFKFSGTLGGLIKLYIGNILLIVLTLGIGFPIAQMRVVRFFVSNMALEGDVDLAAIQQSAGEEPSFGEGLAEGFDMGTI